MAVFAVGDKIKIIGRWPDLSHHPRDGKLRLNVRVDQVGNAGAFLEFRPEQDRQVRGWIAIDQEHAFVFSQEDSHHPCCGGFADPAFLVAYCDDGARASRVRWITGSLSASTSRLTSTARLPTLTSCNIPRRM